MQKRAARRGQRALAFLLCLLMVVTLLPVMGASAAEGGSGTVQPGSGNSGSNPVLSKYLYLNTDGTYSIRLEAYATGTTTTTIVDKAVPLDIVLVLDQSGSMAYNFDGQATNTNTSRRQYAMKNAVTTFIAQVAEKYTAEADHRMALVTFGSSASTLRGWTAVDASGKNALTNSVNGLPTSPSGATNVAAGMTQANSLLNQRYTGSNTAARQQVVIVFTDGVPTTNTAFDTSVANNAISTAKTMKDSGVIVYSVGIFNGAKPDELHGAEYSRRTQDSVPCDGSVGSYWGHTWASSDNSNDFANLDISAGNRFLNYISSNFDATEIGIEYHDFEIPHDLWVGRGYFWQITKNFTRNSADYYLTANDADSLNNVFTSISDSITTPSTPVTLDSKTVLKDVISNSFDVTAGTTVSVATQTGTKASENAEIVWDSVKNSPSGITAVRNDRTIDVTGFDYSQQYIAPTHPGEKLIVWITGLLPNTNGETVYSNAALSGIYDQNGTQIYSFAEPYTTVDTENRVVDFGMTVSIGDNVLNTNAATNQYGTFALNNNTYTYNLKPVKDDNGNYTFGFTGVDSSLYFNDGSWTKVNVIPANNVYYDDTFLSGGDTGISSFNDGKYGYDANVDAATAAGSFKPEGSTTALEAKTNFSFTGSRIDLYCTTTDNSNAVVAALWKAEDFGKADAQPIASKYMINTYESGTLYNVPTLSFDAGEVGDYVLVLYATESSNYRLDGVRVYQPGDDDAKNLYDADEKNATFTKVRDLLLEANSFNDGDASVTGVVYTDQIREGSHNTTAIDTYEKVGPKNEVYLAKDNAIAFKVSDYQPGKTVMVGLSAPEAKAAGTIQVTDDANKKDIEIKSNVDMYYEVTPTADGCVVIRNNSDALISVTNVKLSGAAAAEAAALSVDDGLLAYMASFNTLEVTEPTPVDPEPTPEPPVENNTISAIIHAIWAQVKTSIDRLFGRL